MKGATYAEAETAKRLLAARLAGRPELRGIGIAVLDAGFGVKVNLARPLDAVLPPDIDGVPVLVSIVDTIVPL